MNQKALELRRFTLNFLEHPPLKTPKAFALSLSALCLPSPPLASASLGAEVFAACFLGLTVCVGAAVRVLRAFGGVLGV